MKNKRLFIGLGAIAIALAILAIIIFTPKKIKKPDSAFTPYISAFTSGIISNQSTIRMVLMEDIPGAVENKPLEQKLFSFNPGIKGQTYYVNSHTIEFRPEELLTSGETYNVEFKLGKIMDVPEKMKTFEFSFQTMEQSYESEYTNIKAYDNKNLQWQQITGVLTLADFAPAEKVEEMLEALQDNEPLKVTWEHKADGIEHIYTIDSIKRKESADIITLKWDGKALGIKKDYKQKIEIPALGDFKVLKTTVVQQPEQYASIIFSDPLNEDQDLTGLVHFSTGTTAMHIIEGNEIRIIPTVRQTGKKDIIIEPSVENSLGYNLGEKFTYTLSFESIKPKVELIGKGNILPGSNGLIFPFKAVSLSAVNVRIIKIYQKNIKQFFQVNQFDGDKELKRVGRVVYKGEVQLTSDKVIDLGEWNTFSLDLSELIEVDPGAMYRIQINFDQNQSLFPCQEGEDAENNTSGISETIQEEFDPALNESDEDYWSYYGYNDYSYSSRYNWSERDDPCKPSYYMRYNQAVEKNILASNLGIIAKQGKTGELIFIVNDLITTDPLSGVELHVYNYQQQLVQKLKTDGKGMARINIREKPFFLVAQHDGQYGYLRLDDGSSLSLSMFNVSGRETQEGLKGFIYGERGVWRPGDTIFLSVMIEDQFNKLPENHPVILDLLNPKGQIANRKVKTEGEGGLYVFRLKTGDEAPTGNWTAKVKVGGATFNKTLKIETIKPNRLKIQLNFSADRLTKQNIKEPATLSVKWLHGATARNLQAEVDAVITSTETSFEDYPGYIFDDPARDFSSKEQRIFDGQVNEQGTATVYPDFNIYQESPGMLNIYFKTRTYETSGNFSTARFKKPYSPYQSYVGVKVPRGSGWGGAINSTKPHKISLVTVDEDGNPVNRNNLEVKVYRLSWRWWWQRHRHDNLSRYVSSSSRYLIDEGTASTKNGKGTYSINIDEKYWGRALIRIIDNESGHATGKIVYMTWPGWRDESNQLGGASMLRFSTNKETYNVGEEVIVKMPESNEGRAFVTLESGSEIVDGFWVETNEESTEFKFEATNEMAPNVYVYISLLQPHNQTKNDLPIRLYGVQPIKVEDPETHLNPNINMPKVLRPNEKATIKISENDGKEMNYTVAVVDEGLLDLTGFTTPDPWNHFYARDALGVKTWDMYDYVIGAFSGEFAGLLEIGGGMGLKKQDSKKANRFEPVVKFFGPFHLKSGRTNEHTFTMPNYIGSVKTMVVACENAKYGSAEKVTPVKKPLMVLATLPRVIGPKEKIQIPVTVFAMEKNIRNVNVSVKTNNMLIPRGSTTRKITFPETGDQTINFESDVAPKLGKATIQIIAKSGYEEAVYETEIQVRAPNPQVTKTIDGFIEKGQTWSAAYNPVGIKGTNEAVLEVSGFMPMNLEKRLDFLIRYPYGCIEQTTSSVFPQLFLDQLVKLSESDKQSTQKNIKSGINRLMQFQNSEGGFSYWPGKSHASEWGTNYAGHFLIEAKNKGYNIPSGMLKQWLRFQKKAARKWSTNFPRRHYDDLTQVYRLYTLALAGEPEMGAMNRMRQEDGLRLQSKWRLAAAYHLAGKTRVAKDIIKNLSIDVKDYRELGYTYGSSTRDLAMILETLSLMEEKITGKKVADRIAEKMGSGRWYSTQTTAYSLLALSKFIGRQSDEPVKFSYSIDGKSSKNAITDMPVTRIKLNGETKGTVKLQNNGSSSLFVKVIQQGIPTTDDRESSQENLQMSVRYLNMQNNEIQPTEITQGTDFYAEVTVKHPGILDTYENMALKQIFPSGWEIHNARMDEYNASYTVDKPDYQDIRDDRVYSHFDLYRNQRKVFRIKLNAAYLGTYYLPSVYCEAMYDNDIHARKTGQWVNVILPEKQ